MLNTIAAAGIVIFSIVMAADGRGKSLKLRIGQVAGGLAIAAVILL